MATQIFRVTVREGARARAVALLDSLGAGHRDLKVDGTDMADVWR